MQDVDIPAELAQQHDQVCGQWSETARAFVLCFTLDDKNCLLKLLFCRALKLLASQQGMSSHSTPLWQRQLHWAQV